MPHSIAFCAIEWGEDAAAGMGKVARGVPHSIAFCAIEWGQDAAAGLVKVSRVPALIFNAHSWKFTLTNPVSPYR